jgi:hypothetical protein
VVFAFINIFLDAFPNLIASGITSASAGLSLFIMLFTYFFGFIIIGGIVLIIVWLAHLYFQAAVVDNARKYMTKKSTPLSGSFDIAKKKFWSVFGATVLATVIAVIAGMVPVIGGIIALVLSWFFLFILQFVVIANKNAVDSLKHSYGFFMKNKLDVFLFWLILMLVSLLLFIVAMIPLMIAAFPIILAFLQIAISNGSFLSLMPLIKQNMVNLFVGGIVSMAILSYITVFQEGASTFFFMQKTKKK